MDKIERLASALEMDYDKLKAILEADETTEEDIQEFADAHEASRLSYYEPQLKKKLEKDITGSSAKGFLLKERKNLNTLLGLGLTNREMEAMEDMKEFYKLAENKYKEKLGASGEAVSEEMANELNKWKTHSTQLQEQLEALENGKADFEDKLKKKYESEFTKKSAIIEYRRKVNEMREKGKIVKAPGIDLALKAIERDLFETYTIDENLNVFEADGSIASHPERKVNVSSAIELLKYHLEKENLIKKNNAGEKPKSFLEIQKKGFGVDGVEKPLSDDAKRSLAKLQSLTGG